MANNKKISFVDLNDGDMLQCYLFRGWVDQYLLNTANKKADALLLVNKRPKKGDAWYRIIRVTVVATGVEPPL